MRTQTTAYYEPTYEKRLREIYSRAIECFEYASYNWVFTVYSPQIEGHVGVAF